MEAQDLGRAARPVDDPVRLAEDGDDMAALDCFDGGDRGVYCRDGGAGGQLGVDLEVEGGARREDDGALEHVLQLADVPGPSIGDETSHGLPAHSVDTLADASSELVDQEADQERDVLGAFPERGKRDGEDAEAIVEVLAERAGADNLEQVAVGGGDDPDIDRDGRAAADALDLALLQDAEELGLGLRGELADLVEEKGAAVGQLEAADPPGDGAGEGALLVAEQLALDQAGGQGGAVDLDQWPGRALAVRVDRPGNQLLAGPGLAGDERSGVGRSHPADLVQHGQQRGGPAHDLLEIVDRLELFLEVEVLLLEAGALRLGTHPVSDVDPDRMHGGDASV